MGKLLVANLYTLAFESVKPKTNRSVIAWSRESARQLLNHGSHWCRHSRCLREYAADKLAAQGCARSSPRSQKRPQ